MFKKILAVSLACVMTLSLVGCGEKESSNADPTPTTGTVTETPTPTQKPARTDLPADAASYVNFEDGASGFAVVAVGFAACDLASTLSVKEFAGSKALVATSPKSDNVFSGTQPFVAIDVVSLLGDKAADVAKFQYDIGLDFRGGAFQAVSGNVVVVNGGESKTPWAVFVEEGNPKAYTIPVANGFGAGSYIYFTSDAGVAATDYDLVLDNIIFYDKDGNVIAPDTKAEFAVDGVTDSFWLNLVWDNGAKQPSDEVILFDGVQTGGSWWPDNKNAWSFLGADYAKSSGYATAIDPANFGPGSVITIYYNNPSDFVLEEGSRWQAYPYLRAQAGKLVEGTLEGISGTCDVWHDWSESDTDGRNSNATIAQYTFEEIRDAYNKTFGTTGDTEWMEYCCFMGVADRGIKVDIYKVTIGKLQ